MSDQKPDPLAERAAQLKQWYRTVFDRQFDGPRLEIRVPEQARADEVTALEYFVQVGATNADEPESQLRMQRIDREDFRVLLDTERVAQLARIANVLDAQSTDDDPATS